MSFTSYSREGLEKISIHDLRSLGRELKVKSPTTLAKAKLIDAILDKIKEGKANAVTQTLPPDNTNGMKEKKRPGRPPKGTLRFADSSPLPNITGTLFNREVEPEVKILDGLTTDLDNAFNLFGDETPTDNKSFDKIFEDVKPKETKQQPESETPRYNNNYKQNSYQKNNNSKPYNKNNNTYNNNNNKYNSTQDRNTQNNQPNQDYSNEPLEIKEGVLEIMVDGYGFLRAKNYESGEHDAYVGKDKIRRYKLRKGDYIKAEGRKLCDKKPASVVNVLEVNGGSPDNSFNRPSFDALVPIYPESRFKLEIPNIMNDFAIRSIDMVAPIGKGQRAMIVSPPKAGKTTLLKKIANSISVNYPEAHLMVLLIDERPEEVTDMKRNIKGEVVFSTFDEMPEHHTKAAEMVLERAKRLVELGKDVVILMDSLTRLARAYNLSIAPTGRTLSGGIDPGALHSPKRFFGAARNIEHGGSLTIIATALIDTGSRMDDVIYEEFKGTGNMEIHLDRKLSEKRIFPAIDLNRSGTRREDLLLDQFELQGVWAMRKMLSVGDTADSTENLINMLVKTKTNFDFLRQINLQIQALQNHSKNNK